MQTRRTKALCTLLFFSATVLSAMEEDGSAKTQLKQLAGDYDLLKLLHNKDNDGNTPLMHAVNNHSCQAVRALVEYRADVNQRNKDGFTPITMAIKINDQDILNLFFTHPDISADTQSALELLLKKKKTEVGASDDLDPLPE